MCIYVLCPKFIEDKSDNHINTLYHIFHYFLGSSKCRLAIDRGGKFLGLLTKVAPSSDLISRLYSLLTHGSVAEIALEEIDVGEVSVSELPSTLCNVIGSRSRLICLRRSDYHGGVCGIILDRLEALEFMEEECLEKKAMTQKIYVVGGEGSIITVGDKNKIEAILSTQTENDLDLKPWQIEGLKDALNASIAAAIAKGISASESDQMENLKETLEVGKPSSILKKIKALSEELRGWLAPVVELIAIFVKK